jgi:Flp pilus assembly protein TadG
MPTFSPSDLAARVTALLRRWKGDSTGFAAVEFALIVPIMGVMFIGAVELSQAIIVDRRVTQVASSTADLVARWAATSGSASVNGITQNEVADIMRVGGYIVAPYTQNPLRITVSSVMSSSTSATNTKQWWSCTFNGTGSTLNCACSNTTYTIPVGLVGTLDTVVLSRVTYDYKPLVFDYFLKKNFTGSGVYTLSENIYQKPRYGNVNLVPTSNVPCPTPTFP